MPTKISLDTTYFPTRFLIQYHHPTYFAQVCTTFATVLYQTPQQWCPSGQNNFDCKKVCRCWGVWYLKRWIWREFTNHFLTVSMSFPQYCFTWTRLISILIIFPASPHFQAYWSQNLKHFGKKAQSLPHPTVLQCQVHSFNFFDNIFYGAKLINCYITLKNNYPQCATKRQRICVIDSDSD